MILSPIRPHGLGFDVASASPGPAAAPGVSRAALQKARAVWLATRSKVEADILKLQSGIASAYAGHDMAQELEDAFTARVEPVLQNLDARLAHKLDEMTQAQNGAHQALAEEVRGIITSYEKFLDTDDVIEHLDRNPIVPLAIRKTLDASLEGLKRVLT